MENGEIKNPLNVNHPLRPAIFFVVSMHMVSKTRLLLYGTFSTADLVCIYISYIQLLGLAPRSLKDPSLEERVTYPFVLVGVLYKL